MAKQAGAHRMKGLACQYLRWRRLFRNRWLTIPPNKISRLARWCIGEPLETPCTVFAGMLEAEWAATHNIRFVMAPLFSNPDALIRQCSDWTACGGAEGPSTSDGGPRDPEAHGRDNGGSLCGLEDLVWLD